MDKDALKKAVGYKAAELVQNKMVVGLGTGSTAYYFIEALIERHRAEKLDIQVVASSSRSLDQAKKGGLPLGDLDSILAIDLTVDGADEIDDRKRLIKGGGGALLREKIVASLSKELVIIVDESKRVAQLGHGKLPVEVVPFAAKATLHKIQKLYPSAQFRNSERKDTLYITDNGNYIVDILFDKPLESPENLDTLLQQIPGVVETGFFFGYAGRVLVALANGQVVTIP